MTYGELPSVIKKIEIDCTEAMKYQYLPVKFPDMVNCVFEERLNQFAQLISTAGCDYVANFGLADYMNSYVYVTAKHGMQDAFHGSSFNRFGYHSDGFLTNDINYIWSDCCPTVFNNSEFNLSAHDVYSMRDMEEQALPQNEVYYDDYTLLRLNQCVIHKVNEWSHKCPRTFVKISFSKDKYDLEGNTHNHMLQYDWLMRPRKTTRNIPQNLELK